MKNKQQIPKFLLLLIIIHQFNYLPLCQNQIIFSPFETSQTQVDGLIKSSLILENKAFLATSTQGLQIFDIQNIKQPTKIGQYYQNDIITTDVNIFTITNSGFKENYIIIANAQEGACILNINNYIPIQCIDLGYQVSIVKQFKSQYIIAAGYGQITLINVDITNINSNCLSILQSWSQSIIQFHQAVFDSDQKFLFIAENSQGMGIYDCQKILDQNSNIFISHTTYFERTTGLAISKDDDYVYIIDEVVGVYISDIQILYTNPVITNGDITGQQLIVTSSLPNCIMLSENNQYMFLGIRTYGIEIYDIQDKINIKLQEKLNSQGYAYSISLPKDETFLLFCNGNKIKIYEQLTPNLNQDFPNIFQNNQSTVKDLARVIQIGSDPAFLEENIGNPWRVVIDQNNRYLFIASARTGAQIWDIQDPYHPVFVEGVDPFNSNNPTDGIAITQNYLYIGEGWTGIKIYDISSLPTITQVGNILDLQGDSDDIQINQDETKIVVANGSSGVVIVDITDKANPTKIGQWSNNKSGGSVENVLLNQSGQEIFVSLRHYGLIILQFQQGSNNPIEISEYPSGMCEFVTLSPDEKQIFLSDGTQGITILDITNLHQPVYLNSIPMDGFPTKMRLLKYQNNQQFLLVATRDRELLSAIDITDLNNPYLFAKFDSKLESGYDLAITQDNKFCYLVTDLGLRILPIQTEINIHTEFIILNANQEEITNNQITQNNQNQKIVEIGQNVQIYFVPIGIGRQVKIDQIYYYNHYNIDEKPVWMTFDQNLQSITLNVNKEGLDEENIQQTNLLFANLLINIQDSDFENASLSITNSDSVTIFNDLKSKGYLDEENNITEQFKYYQDMYNLDSSNPLYSQTNKDFISEILAKQKVLVPVKFIIKDSLQINLEQIESGNIITTQSDYIIIDIFILDEQKAVFIEKLYQKSLVIISENSTHISIEGPKESTLSTLYEDLRVQNMAPLEDVEIKFVIDDKINYIKTIDTNLKEFSFIKIHEGVTINIEIQKQFNDVFEGGIVQIDEEFSFQFSDKTFNSPANIGLIYTVYLENEEKPGQFDPFPQDYWMYSNSIDRRISGTPPTARLYSKTKVKVIASDGYTQAESIFEIKIWSFSALYIILQTMEIGGPILAILGLYSYKYTIYALTCKKYYSFSQQKIFIGQEFIKIIPLMRNSLGQGKYIIKKLNTNKQKYWDKDGNFFEDVLIKMIKEQFDQNNKKIVKLKINLTDLDIQNSRLYQVLIGLGALNTLKQHKQSKIAYQKLKEYGIKQKKYQDWYLPYVDIQYDTFDINSSQIFPESIIKENKIHKILQNVGQIQILNQESLFTQNDLPKKADTTYNYNLLKQCLIAQVHGISFSNILFPILSKGIGIHCYEYELDKVLGYQKVKKSTCLQDGYEQCGLSTNTPLPSWLLVEVRNGCMILKGTPRGLDKGVLKIKIYMDSGCIVRQFSLDIQNENNDEYQSSTRDALINSNNMINNQKIQTVTPLSNVLDSSKQELSQEDFDMKLKNINNKNKNNGVVQSHQRKRKQKTSHIISTNI